MNGAVERRERLLTDKLVPNIVAPLSKVSPDGCRSPPVFLHSSFRTGSTWLWQKLREAPATLAYYEIFNETLETLTPEQASRIDFASWPSKHPISSPYFLEFLPFIGPGGGLPGFDQGMGFEGIIPAGGSDGDLHPAQYAHVERLIAAAWSQRRMPILSCTRSLGRARGLRRAFGGHAILLHRNLFHQWSSYCVLAENGDPSFIFNMCRTILAAKQDPYLRGVVSWFGLKEDSHAARGALFPVFVLLHLYLYSIAFDAADLVVDLTEITTDASTRRHVERRLSEMIGHVVDLSDVRPACESTSLDVAGPRQMRDTIEQFAKLIPASAMSSEAVDFIDQAKDRALAEWDRCEFFTRRTRTVLTRRIEDAAVDLEAHREKHASLHAEIERLVVGSAEISRRHAAERERHEAEVRELTSRRDALSRDLSASETARAGLDTTITELSAERETVIADATAAAAQREMLEKALADITADRERPFFHRAWERLSRKARRRSA